MAQARLHFVQLTMRVVWQQLDDASRSRHGSQFANFLHKLMVDETSNKKPKKRKPRKTKRAKVDSLSSADLTSAIAVTTDTEISSSANLQTCHFVLAEKLPK